MIGLASFTGFAELKRSLREQTQLASFGVEGQPGRRSGPCCGHTYDMDTFRQSSSIVVNRSPDEVYDLVSDIPRMGNWSPICKACWWDEGDGPAVGAKFTGRNELPERTWETRSEVIVADRGRGFAWTVIEPPTRARWGFTFAPVAGGTELTETWELPPEGAEFFVERFGDGGAKEIGIRGDQAKSGIAETLSAIKKAADA